MFCKLVILYGYLKLNWESVESVALIWEVPALWLYWYDNTGKRLLTAEERTERLAAKLRELGVNPDDI